MGTGRTRLRWLVAALTAALSLVVPWAPAHSAPSGDRVTHQAELIHPAGGTDDIFGTGVAVSGDTAVVGAPFDDTTAGADAGSAHVFVRSGNKWTLQATLVPPAPTAGANFGGSVAVLGDTAVVGAIEFGVLGGAGSAYVFVRSGSTWSHQATLTDPAGAEGDFFGVSVALSGDTAIVGASGDDAAAAETGSAHVFVRSGTSGTWSHQATLTHPAAASDDNFGYSVALSGDTALVGAYRDDTGAFLPNNEVGSAQVFVRSGAAWSHQAELVHPTGDVGDFFGESVALSGDTAVVGARQDDTTAGGADAGSAQVFVRSGTVWSHQAELTHPAGAVGDFFGISVALSGDTVVVGAVGDDTTAGANAGSGQMFVRSGTTWSHLAELLHPAGAADDQLGLGVALDQDTAVLGARLDDTTAATNAGSAQVFTRHRRGPSPKP